MMQLQITNTCVFSPCRRQCARNIRSCFMGKIRNISSTRKGFLEKKQMSPPPPQSHQSCHPCTQQSSCSTFVPSIIKIFRRVFVLQSRDKKSNSNTRRGDDSKRKKKPKLSFLYVTCHLVLFDITTKYHQNIPKSVRLTKRTLNQCIISVKYNKGR